MHRRYYIPIILGYYNIRMQYFLTAPGMSPKGPLVFTAPPGTILAGGRTNYMVVFSSPGGSHVVLDSHKSDGYDSSTLTGFSIRKQAPL